MGTLSRNGLIVCSISGRFSRWIWQLTEWVLNISSPSCDKYVVVEESLGQDFSHEIF